MEKDRLRSPRQSLLDCPPKVAASLPSEFIISPCRSTDLPAVEEIERLSFPTPWDRQSFEEELRRPFARLEVLRPKATGMVVAFCDYWLVADEVQILNIASHPAGRRQGFAGHLLTHIVAQAHLASFRLLSLEVRRSNLPAQSLYRKFGFRDVGIRPRYYADNQEDAVLMDLVLRA